jgi:hypothetical protein
MAAVRMVGGPLLSSLLLIGAPLAASPLPDAAFAEKVDRLMHWIADHSSLEVPDHQPAFLFLSTETINYTMAGSRYTGQDKVVAAFARTGAGVVFLPAEGFADDVLLHELVHFMQMTTGRKASCVGNLEHEAYDLQAQFTAETGIGEPLDPLTLLIATACPPPWEHAEPARGVDAGGPAR